MERRKLIAKPFLSLIDKDFRLGLLPSFSIYPPESDVEEYTLDVTRKGFTLINNFHNSSNYSLPAIQNKVLLLESRGYSYEVKRQVVHEKV